MVVSTVPCWGCAEVLSVSMSLCCRASCATFFALIGLMWVRARKSSPYVLTMAQNWRLMARRASLLCRAPGSRALLLAVLTLLCAAKPYWWHGGQPAQATTHRVNMRIKGPRHPPTGPRNPPIGLTCAGRGPGRHLSGYRASESAHVRRMRSQKQKWGLTARRRPDAPHASSDTTEAGPRRVPPLVACDGRAVSAEKSP